MKRIIVVFAIAIILISGSAHSKVEAFFMETISLLGTAEKPIVVRTYGQVCYIMSPTKLIVQVPQGHLAELITQDPDKIIKVYEKNCVVINPGDVVLLMKKI